MKHGLLLLGHGSHLHDDSSRPVYEHARRLRETGDFCEVRVGFWKEEPSLSRAMDGCDAGDITVVPLLISSGYFAEQIIPREMKLNGPITRRQGRTIRYTEPIGGHPALASVIVERAVEAGGTGTSSVVVLGHGTDQSAHSETNIYRQTNRVRALSRFAEVTTLFLDQSPSLGLIWERTTATDIVVVPLFMANGWHVGQSIPVDLSLDGRDAIRQGRHVRVSEAVGTHTALTGVILQLARNAQDR